jgi:hypothetical protein
MKTGKYLFRNLIFISLLITLIGSCRKYDLNGDVVDDSRLLEKLYLNAKDTIEIDNQNFILETELYRDFFPGDPGRNTRLFASIYLVNIDSSLISKKFEIKSLNVINENQIWISTPKLQEDNSVPVYKVYGLSKNGPEWDTDIYVDVVIAVKDLSTEKIEYLIARDQLIVGTE